MLKLLSLMFYGRGFASKKDVRPFAVMFSPNKHDETIANGTICGTTGFCECYSDKTLCSNLLFSGFPMWDPRNTTSLSLDSNRLSEVPPSIWFPGIKVLNLNNNLLTVFPKAPFPLPNLQTVSLWVSVRISFFLKWLSFVCIFAG